VEWIVIPWAELKYQETFAIVNYYKSIAINYGVVFVLRHIILTVYSTDAASSGFGKT
jgi:hypothetical protein